MKDNLINFEEFETMADDYVPLMGVDAMNIDVLLKGPRRIRMKLWIIKRFETHGYDEIFGFVIRAEDETAARQLAANAKAFESPSVWLESKYSSCEELLSEGDESVIMRDANWG